MAMARAPLLDSVNPCFGAGSGKEAFFEKILGLVFEKREGEKEEEEEDLIPAEMERRRTFAIAADEP